METNWKVLLIGGPSGIGKTYLANHLSKHYGCPYLRTDHLRFFLQNLLEQEKERYPLLFSEVDEKTNSSYPKKAEFMKAGLLPLINKLTNYSDKPAMIIEGIELLPETLELKATPELKGIYLYDSVETIKDRLIKRNRNDLKELDLDNVAKTHEIFGEYIKKQAEKTGFYTLKTTPENTMVERAINLLDQP